MLEAQAHNELKILLQKAGSPWPHNLTLSRLVSRSFRRRDTTLVRLDLASHDFWWIGLLLPLCLQTSGAVLHLSAKQRNRLLMIELPRLKEQGFDLPIWEGASPPEDNHLWLLDSVGLIEAYQNDFLKARQLIFPEAEYLVKSFTEAMAIEITYQDWENIIRLNPSFDLKILHLYERMTRQLFSQSTHANSESKVDLNQILSLKDILNNLVSIPIPWSNLLKFDCASWASWANLDHKLLNWTWHLKPLDPINCLYDIFSRNPILFLSRIGLDDLFMIDLKRINFPINVKVDLGIPNLQDPISLFAPDLQPLPNTSIYSDYILDQCRRLILGRSGLTIILLNDNNLRKKLTAQLAAEFGLRVLHENINPEINGVVCCSFSWWLNFHEHLPNPDQLIVPLLPIASLEAPFTSAKVDSFKRRGSDWFRDFLLPDALSTLVQSISPIRGHRARVAILDGRIRSRSWGTEVFRALEPWIPLTHLLLD